jgi:DNA polymerase-1
VGPWSKLRGYAARLALILHFLRWACGEVEDQNVDGESMERAARLVAYFKSHARKVYAVMDADPRLAEARHVFQWLAAHPELMTFTRRDVHQGLRKSKRFENPGNLDAPLKLLEQHGFIRATHVETHFGPGRRPSERFERNPRWVCPQNTQYPQKARSRDSGTPSTPNSEDIEYSEDVPQAVREGPVGAATKGTGIDRPGVCEDLEEMEDLSREPGAAVSAGTAARGRYVLVSDPDGLQVLAQALDESDRIGLDTETTGLNTHTDRMRLLSLATERGTFLIDCFAVDTRPLWPALAEKTLVIHNAAFDVSFLARLGFIAGAVKDTMLLSQILYAGRRESNKLQDCAQRELGRTLDKELQHSNWSGSLTQQQLEYAATDVDVLIPLCKILDAKLTLAGLAATGELECRCLPAIVWLGQAGVAFDTEMWRKLAEAASADAERLAKELDAQSPPREGFLTREGAWDWDSPAQVKEALKAIGIELESTDDDALARAAHPFAELLRNHREARKRCSTYGKDWLKHLGPSGRVFAHWRQIGATSGRMSCSSPNLQQLPRGVYRKCFVAPAGRVLVKADYSQIELRIAAKVSGDAAMLKAYQDGVDLHILTAQRVLKIEDVTKEQRQLAKALNFGLLYGMGAKGFQRYAKSTYHVDLELAQATAYRDAFFNAYPGLRAWHRMVRNTRALETRTLVGRRLHLAENDFDTLRLNAPVQGTGADGLKRALALLWERRGEVPRTFPVLVVHDEIVVETDQDQAHAVSAWLRKAMLDSMVDWLAPVPVEVEVNGARTWGGG